MKNDVECICDGWKNGAEQIFVAQIRDTMETGVKYTGGTFEYCPWCGQLLKKRVEDECLTCGRPMFKSDNKCPACGTRR